MLKMVFAFFIAVLREAKYEEFSAIRLTTIFYFFLNYRIRQLELGFCQPNKKIVETLLLPT